MKKLLILICILYSINSKAQMQAINWNFGNQMALSFSTSPPTVVSGSHIDTYEGCASISDTGGNLLFYSDGVTVWNSNNAVMANGTGLGGGSSSTQSCIAVLKPGSTSFYYLVTTPEASNSLPLTYATIDMTLNGGLGGVVVKNVFLSDSSSEKLTAVRHANGTDVWVISHRTNSNVYQAWLITASGISTTPVISAIGTPFVNIGIYSIGYMKASPCGDKFVSCLMQDKITELFDFDNSTGMLSNPVVIYNPGGSSNYGHYGCEFSPDGSRLYATQYSPVNVFQYNLLAGSNAAIIASQTVVGTSTGIYAGALQQGPDGRIYQGKFNSQYIGCILNPNALGAACNYNDSYISISPNAGRPGLPNFVTSTFCGINVGINNPASENTGFSVYPNPASTVLNVNFSADVISNASVEITNTLGAVVYRAAINSRSFNNTVTIPLNNRQAGLYFVTLRNANTIQTRKFVVK